MLKLNAKNEEKIDELSWCTTHVYVSFRQNSEKKWCWWVPWGLLLYIIWLHLSVSIIANIIPFSNIFFSSCHFNLCQKPSICKLFDLFYSLSQWETHHRIATSNWQHRHECQKQETKGEEERGAKHFFYESWYCVEIIWNRLGSHFMVEFILIPIEYEIELWVWAWLVFLKQQKIRHCFQ